MPQSHSKPRRPGKATSPRRGPKKAESRYTVSFAPAIADQVARYAQTGATSMSKAIATLVRLGLEEQENRKREFFKNLKANLQNDDPQQQDQLVDEFRTLILGR